MIKEARGFGSTIDEAKENAIANLNASDDEDIQFEVISTPKKKTLGLFGGSKAEVRVFVELPDEKPKAAKKPAPKPPAKQQKPQAKTEKIPAKEEKPAAKPEKPQQRKKEDLPEKKSSDEMGYGPKVDASEIPADSQAGTAVAYLKRILTDLGCTNLTAKVALKDNGALIELDGEGLGVVIGRRGETLDSLQYLTGLAANNGGGYYKVSLNIGNYREKREETLITLAKRVSSQVLKTGRSRSLEPMNPYERRIIHTTVQAIDGVVSNSFGEGSGRRVVIAVEGGDTRPPKRENTDRRDNYSRPRKPRTQETSSPAREPKKDSDIPLYGKIN